METCIKGKSFAKTSQKRKILSIMQIKVYNANKMWGDKEEKELIGNSTEIVSIYVAFFYMLKKEKNSCKALEF